MLGSSSVRTLTSDFTGAKKREEAQNYGRMIVGKIMNSKIIGGAQHRVRCKSKSDRRLAQRVSER